MCEAWGDLSSMNGVSQIEVITASLCIRPAGLIGVASAAGSNADHGCFIHRVLRGHAAQFTQEPSLRLNIKTRSSKTNKEFR